MPSNNLRINDWGEAEKRCSKCLTWWPADNDFFSYMGKGKLNSWCKACCQEHREYVGTQKYKERNGVKLFARG